MIKSNLLRKHNFPRKKIYKETHYSQCPNIPFHHSKPRKKKGKKPHIEKEELTQLGNFIFHETIKLWRFSTKIWGKKKNTKLVGFEQHGILTSRKDINRIPEKMVFMLGRETCKFSFLERGEKEKRKGKTRITRWMWENGWELGFHDLD